MTMSTTVNKRELGAGLVVLAIGIVFLLWSQIYPPRMSAMPKLVGWATIVLALIDIAAHFDNRFQPHPAPDRRPGDRPASAARRKRPPSRHGARSSWR